MIGTMMKRGLAAIALAVGLWPAFPSAAIAQDDAKDWPMYNRDVFDGSIAIECTGTSGKPVGALLRSIGFQVTPPSIVRQT